MDSGFAGAHNQQIHGWSGHTITTGRSALVIGNQSNNNQDESAANSSNNNHNNQEPNRSVSRFHSNNQSLAQDSIGMLVKTGDEKSNKKDILKGSESIKDNM
jgi:hypothetical protein